MTFRTGTVEKSNIPRRTVKGPFKIGRLPIRTHSGAGPDGMTIEATIKLFLDKPEIVRRLANHERKAFLKIGGYIRQTMRRSMRLSTGSTPHSEPLKPPRYNPAAGIGNIRNAIMFFYDARRHSVVIGPVILKGAPSGSGVRPTNRRTIPELIDKGGMAAGPRQRLLLNRRTGKLIYPWSRGGRMILKKKNALGPGGNYRWITIRPGTRMFRARFFSAPAMAKVIRSGKVNRALQTVGFK